MREYISVVAEDYYNAQFRKYREAGFSVDEAEDQADMDLIEWSNPPAYDLTGSDEEFYGLELSL